MIPKSTETLLTSVMMRVFFCVDENYKCSLLYYEMDQIELIRDI